MNNLLEGTPLDLQILALIEFSAQSSTHSGISIWAVIAIYCNRNCSQLTKSVIAGKNAPVTDLEIVGETPTPTATAAGPDTPQP